MDTSHVNLSLLALGYVASLGAAALCQVGPLPFVLAWRRHVHIQRQHLTSLVIRCCFSAIYCATIVHALPIWYPLWAQAPHLKLGCTLMAILVHVVFTPAIVADIFSFLHLWLIGMLDYLQSACPTVAANKRGAGAGYCALMPAQSTSTQASIPSSIKGQQSSSAVAGAAQLPGIPSSPVTGGSLNNTYDPMMTMTTGTIHDSGVQQRDMDCDLPAQSYPMGGAMTLLAQMALWIYKIESVGIIRNPEGKAFIYPRTSDGQYPVYTTSLVATTRAKLLGALLCVCTWPITMLTLQIAVNDPLPFERSNCSGWEFYGVVFLFTICLGIYAMIAYSTIPIGRGYSIELNSLRATLGWSFVLAVLLLPFYLSSMINAKFMATPRSQVGTYFWALLFECTAGALRGWRPVFLVWLQHKRDREWNANLPEARLRRLLTNPEAIAEFKQFCIKHYCSELLFFHLDFQLLVVQPGKEGRNTTIARPLSSQSQARRQSTHNSLRYPALLSGLRESSTAASASRAGTVVRMGIASDNATVALLLTEESVHNTTSGSLACSSASTSGGVPQQSALLVRPISAPSSSTSPGTTQGHYQHHQNHSSNPANDSASTSNTASGPLTSVERLDQSSSRAGMSSLSSASDVRLLHSSPAPPTDTDTQMRPAPLAQVREAASNSSSLPDAVRAAIAPFLDPCEPVPEDTHSEALPTDSLALRLKYFMSRYIQPGAPREVNISAASRDRYTSALSDGKLMEAIQVLHVISEQVFRSMLEGVFARYDVRNGPQPQPHSHPHHMGGGHAAHRGGSWTPAAAGHVIRERVRSSRHASSKSGTASSTGGGNGVGLVAKATVPMSPVGEEGVGRTAAWMAVGSGPSSVSMPPTQLSSALDRELREADGRYPGAQLPP